MSKILLLDKILASLVSWTKEHHKMTTQIEDNILQRDFSSKFEEKIISIGLSSLLVYIGMGILGALGVATGGFLVAIILFPIGWGISKLINKKVFGDERKIEDTNEDEQTLLTSLNKIDEDYKTMGLQTKFKKIPVHFTAYPTYKKQLQSLKRDLLAYDASSLALKYKYQHKYIVKKYIKLANQFDTIYAHKQGERYA